jgi:solute carrier family 8 (sodium/calcium exchanger)
VKSSAHMEKEGLIRCVKTFSNEGIQIQTLITDRHVQIVKWVRENVPETTHCFDVWHVAKSYINFLYPEIFIG